MNTFFWAGLFFGGSLFSQGEIESSLNKGPLVLVETDDNGRFKAATGIILIKAPVDTVWKTLIDYNDYVNFMPKVAESKIQKTENNTMLVSWEIEMPGPNSTYVMKHVLNEKEYEIDEGWLEGDIKGTHYRWKLQPKDDKTTIGYFGGTTKNFSVFLEKLDDEQQTITVGVNVGTVLAVVKAIKKKSERLASDSGTETVPSGRAP